MRKPSFRGTFTALATLALCACGPLAVTAVTGPAAAKTETAATATSAAACTSRTTGVTVVVDFTHFTGKVKVACDPTDPQTGLAALTGAGFEYSFVPGQPFVCRIDYLPKPCNGHPYPPATAFWSYWHASRGGKWIFSNTGAGSYHPAPGSVQGWAFGAGKPPRVAPPG